MAQPEATIAEDAARLWQSSATHGGVQDLSHWRGKGRWAQGESWMSIGKPHVALYQHLRSLATAPGPLMRMLEWGPGGGANAVHFGPHVERYYGVDISPANLDECGRQLQACGLDHFRSIPIHVDQPESVLAQLAEPVDFFLCTAVFQHFPSKGYGQRVTRIAADALCDGGMALIQIRYDDGSDALRSKDSDYFTNFITFTSYAVEEYWQVAVQAGFTPLAVVLRPETRYAYYLLQRG